MDEIEIKDEYNTNNQCQTCLSVGRKLKPIGKYIAIYKKIVSDYPPDHMFPNQDILQVLLCWECEALLRRAQQFQEHVRKIYLHSSLSNLTTILLNETHRNIIYINETHKSTDEKYKSTDEKHKSTDEKHKSTDEKHKTSDEKNKSSDISDDDFDTEQLAVIKSELKEENIDKRIKKRNKWALKRAEKNKKPKFRIIENVSECFRIFKMDDSEIEHSMQRKAAKDIGLSEFNCNTCLVSFDGHSLLTKHLKRCKESSNYYVCDICKKSYTNKRHLSAHVEKHYYKYSCLVCALEFLKKKDVSVHLKKEHKRIFECIKCLQKFGHRREFFKHYKDRHEKFICDYCGVSFKMRYCIKDHIRKQHSPFECKPCNKRFARYGGLWLHNKVRHSTPTAGAYCVECDKKYVDVYRYRWHLNNSARHRRTQAKKRIPCPNCEKVFTKNIYMKDHYNLVHLKNFKYRCEECDKNFIRNADLVKHKRRVHEGILPPKNKICFMCGRGFTTRKILTNHLRTHTGERPFACACGARFAQHAALNAHARARGHYNLNTRPPT
ncbi:zinc finger protein 184-like isoform X2 [Amyelois transitella]|uniref:zinc finger protein 184-like isoform X2 n=1 Tax=Amyelois transitella TaxID=680683 RepID=UPI00298FEF7B|nr:zinc finger protein 184-like isoform X2 [Amyelois transitella]